jgi:hypothetical protein
MGQLQALVFLNVRQLVNGVRRAFTSARRIVGLVFFVAYYLFFFARPFSRARGENMGFNELQNSMAGKLPTVQFSWLNAVVFTLFFVAMMFTAFSLTGYNGRFRQADVDTLFPTPVDRRLILFFRFLRDSLLSTLVPLFVALIFMRPALAGFTSFVKGMTNPHAAAYVTSLGFIAWLLSSLVWSAWGYAASLYFNRTEAQYESRRAWLFRGIFVVFMGAMIVIALAIRAKPEFQTFVDVMNSSAIRVAGLTATIATKITLGLATGDTLGFVVAVLTMIGLAVAGLWVAMRQTDWMYEIGATNASKMSEVTDLQKKGDLYGIYGARARQGKVNTKRARFVYNWEPKGVKALIWREAIIFFRVGIAPIVLALGIGIMFQVMFSYLPATTKRGKPIVLDLIILAMGIGMPVFTASATAMTSFIEMLKRGDLLKPLPFSPGTTIFFEVLGKSLLSTATAVVLSVVTVIVKPMWWYVGVSGVLAGSSLGVALISLYCMMTILFPDFDDPTQRGFRGLMQLLGMVVCLGPPVGIFALVYYFGHNMILASTLYAIANLAIAFICANIAGNLYRDFNPSE